MSSRRAQPFDYLETEPAPDAPVSDNPSGMYCPPCRASGFGLSHCAHPDYCGNMRLMKPRPHSPTKEER